MELMVSKTDYQLFGPRVSEKAIFLKISLFKKLPQMLLKYLECILIKV
jgi:hypothetical protein